MIKAYLSSRLDSLGAGEEHLIIVPAAHANTPEPFAGHLSALYSPSPVLPMSQERNPAAPAVNAFTAAELLLQIDAVQRNTG